MRPEGTSEIGQAGPAPLARKRRADRAERLHRLVLVALQSVMAGEIVALMLNGQWQSAATVAGIMALTLSPLVLRNGFSVRMPYAFQILVLMFVFAALFLGEVRQFYHLFPWWDSVLHFGSGLLLGMLGFMLIYVLNEDEHIHLSTKPGFMALFAFCFAVSFGALWEVFEYSMDAIFGMQMQKPMLGDEFGLTDTMWDLILDALGGLIVSVYGFVYVRRGSRSFISRWIARVAAENPTWFDDPPARR